ncbi:MAG: type II secretion system protein [Candidatus Saccharimonadales bacterium]
MNTLSDSVTYSSRQHKNGFTIVELLIVIVVMGILAAIIIIAFSGIQRRATTTTLQSDLSNASKMMKVAQVDAGSFPSTLPSTVKSSKSVTLTLAPQGGTPVYSGLTPTQNGLLFYDTCRQLIAEGVGQKPDDGHHYISACNVYNYNQIHIDGWNGRNINTPLTSAALDTYVSSYVGGEKPDFTTQGTNFMTQLKTRFQASGGTFSVTSFWDSWATPVNGGVMKPTMPAPTSTSGSSDPNEFCINATHANYPDLKWHITAGSAPTEGECA